MSGAEAVPGRLAAIEARIDAACRRAGRARTDVTLVGASKQQPAEVLAAAFAAGLRVFGENRVQEALAKAPSLPPQVEWHLLGPLQSNKVRMALRLFRTFHAVDRLSIAHDLEREAARLGIGLSVFLEVNLGDEATKHGLAEGEVAAAARQIALLDHLRLAGLMAIPPPGDDPEASRPWFRRLAGLSRALAGELGPERCGGGLSMGMSDDFEVAIEEGATHVRVGTSLFGPRPPRPAPPVE
jgi:pyridoxal phosphate enzyme (YggS family)